MRIFKKHREIFSLTYTVDYDRDEIYIRDKSGGINK
jgi:hypothetical protein